MILGEIQRLKIIIVRFYFRTFGNIKPDLGKNIANLLIDLGNRMQSPTCNRSARQRDIDFGIFGLILRFELCSCLLEGFLQQNFDFVCFFSGHRSLLHRQLGNIPQELGQSTLATQIAHGDILEVMAACNRFQFFERLLMDVI